MQAHAYQIQVLLARERDIHLRQLGVVPTSLLTVPPRPHALPVAAVARPQASR